MGDTVHGASISDPCLAFKYDTVLCFGGGS